MISVTLQFGSIAEAAAALSRLESAPARVATIAHEDRPDVGTDVSPAPAAPFAHVGFGQGVTLPATATPALSTAAAAAAPIAPVVPTLTAVPVPLAPAAPPAPAAAAALVAAAAPSAPAGIALDTDGLPWDGRIHAATKTTNKDGTWRQKRELPAGTREAVEAELRGALAANAAAAPVSAPVAVPVPPAPVAGVPVPPAAVVWDFGLLAEQLTMRMVTGEITHARAQEVFAKHGAASLGALALMPNVVPAVAAELGLSV